MPELGELLLGGEKDVAGGSKVFPLQSMTSLTQMEDLRLVKKSHAEQWCALACSTDSF